MVDYPVGSGLRGGVISNAEANVFIPENWYTDVIRERAKSFAAIRYVSVMPFSGGKGDTIRKPRIGRLGSHKKLPGNPVMYQTRSETEWLMRVRQQEESSFSLDNLTTLQSNVPLRREYTKATGEALAEHTDNMVLAERASYIGYDSANHIISSSPISYANILAAWDIMKRRRYKNELALLVGPGQYASLFNEDKFIQNGQFNSGNLANIPNGAFVGTILGIPVVMLDGITRNSLTGWTNGDEGAPEPTPGMTGAKHWPTQSGTEDSKYSWTPASLTADYWTAMLIAKSSLVVAVQKRPSVQAYWNYDFQEWRVINLQIMDAKVQDPRGCVCISTDEDNLIV